MAEITVIVPVYKVEKYLARCLDSIVAQTYRNFDVILVDDGSPDSCPIICDSYVEQDNRFHVIHQVNAGIAVVRNVGVKWALTNSDSKWITFIDSDDWVHPQYLEVLLSAKNNAQTDVSIVGFERTTGPSPVVDALKAKAECVSPQDFFCEDYTFFTVVWGKLFPKAAFKKLSFPIGKIHEDEYVTWKILFAYDKLAIVKQPLYAYFKNDSGIMNSPWSLKHLDMLDALEERLIFFKKHGYAKAFEIEKEHYLWHVMDSIKRVENSDLKERSVKRKLLLRLRRILKIGNYSILEKDGLYEIAYPKTFRLRFFIATKIQKFKGR